MPPKLQKVQDKVQESVPRRLEVLQGLFETVYEEKGSES